MHVTGSSYCCCVRNTAQTYNLQGVLNTCLSYTSEDLGITEAKGGAVITSVLLVGAAIGGFFAGQVADAIGPCRALLWNNAPLLAGSLLGAFAPHGSLGFCAMLLGACYYFKRGSHLCEGSPK